MTLHLFGAIVTANGIAANNRGNSDGSNITPLQKIIWNGEVHTTVSAEAIRYALRRRLAESEETNRHFATPEDRVHAWHDPSFKRWAKGSKDKPFIDDDLLGFMSATAGKQEGEKGDALVRRAVIEITRAVSLAPWPGDVTFNAASPGATPSAAKKKNADNPVPYGTEMHATRYQYGFALPPDRLHDKARAAIALRGLCALGEVAGNHGRFLFDFSPESVIFRVSHDPAPRILNAFDLEGGVIGAKKLRRLLESGDVEVSEVVLGGPVADQFADLVPAAQRFAGVRKACEAIVAKVA